MKKHANNRVKSLTRAVKHVNSLSMMSLLCALPGAGVLAQEAPESGISEIAVTGSRISRSGMTTPTPVTAVQAEDLNNMAPGNMVDAVSQLPQFFGNETLTSSTNWFVRSGYGNLNLRGLGVNRTLTLLNNRRMVSSTAFGGVDINVFPEAMLRSVETVTGGASAAYGTDAVAGVTNFLLDTDYVGFEAHAQAGTTSREDADSMEASLSFGTDIGTRTHLLFSAEYYEQDGIHSYEGRDWYQAWGTVPDDNGMLLVRPQVVSRNSSFDGIVFAPGSALNGMEFHSDGSYSPYVVSDLSFGTTGTPPARQSIVGGGSGEDTIGGDIETILPDNERSSMFLYLDHELTNNLTVYGQAIKGGNKTSAFNRPRGSLHGTPTAVTIFQDNAYLPESMREAMIDEGLESFTLRRDGHSSDFAADYTLKDKSDMLSLSTGFTWDIQSDGFFDGWVVDGYYQYGENERKWYQNGMRVDRIHAAVDAVTDPETGATVCRSTLFSDHFAGCVPVNLFGRGSPSSAAVDWLMGFESGEQITTPLYFADDGFASGKSISYTSDETKVNITEMEQQLLEISANGEAFDGWYAGPISLAFGASYREEEIYQVVHDSTNRSSDHVDGHPVLCDDPAIGLRGVSTADCLNTVGVQYSKVSNIKGKIDVTEAFVETLVPLVSGADYMEQMNLSLSTRWADYSGSGEVWAWKAGLDMEFNDEWRLRSTVSQDVRAANLSERFDRTGGAATVMDPMFDNETVQVTFFSGGNPSVAPEKAHTLTAGLVYQPLWLDGLQMSLDWYEVNIEDAIGQLGVQAVVNQCFAGAADLCDQVTRNPDTNQLVLVGDTYINIDEAEVSGIDFEIDYSRDIELFGGEPEFFGLRLFASYLSENSETLAGADTIDRAGQVGIEQSTGNTYSLPDFKYTASLNYSYGPLSVFLQGRFIDSGTSENALVEGVDIDSNEIDSVFYTDLNLRYDIEMDSGAQLELFGNVTNMFDEDPPVTPYFSAFWGGAIQTNGGLYDLLGRRFTAGVRVRY